MATVEVAPYFGLFLLIATLNTEGSMHNHNLKKMKFTNLWCKYHNFLWHASRDRWVLKTYFFPFDYTLKNKKGSPKYKQILPTVFTLLYKQIKKCPILLLKLVYYAEHVFFSNI
jgi:hypothetical protein